MNLERDRAIEHWLRTEVAVAHDAMKADPGRALSPGQGREQLSSRRHSRSDASRRELSRPVRATKKTI